MKLTIVMATDFSDSSEAALNYLLKFIAKAEINLFLLYVQPVPLISSDLPYDVVYKELKHAREVSHRNLLRMSKKIISLHPEVKLNYIFEEGDVEERIVDTAKDLKPDLLVIGTKSKGNFFKWFEGSTTSYLIRSACSPVMVVPQDVKFKEVRECVFASSFQDEDKIFINHAGKISSLSNARLSVLNVVKKLNDSAKERLMKFTSSIKRTAKYHNLEFKVREGHEEVEREIGNYLHESRPQLVFMATHKKTFMQKLLGKSITEKVAEVSPVPLIVYHTENEAEKQQKQERPIKKKKIPARY